METPQPSITNCPKLSWRMHRHMRWFGRAFFLSLVLVHVSSRRLASVGVMRVVNEDIQVAIARRFHLFPFRTEKLSFASPMVLRKWESRQPPF